jgi:GTP-binding protein LepA
MDIKKHPLNTFEPKHIRNFSIIAHIDHGKSTLADRLLETTGTLSTRNKNEQFLDKLQVEKERGITVKAQTASMVYEYKGTWYLLNLIDTPGHVDFSYEVSRSLYACQGAVLLVDAGQGVQAQTMANFYLAFDQNLTIVPVLNKIDLPTADPQRVAQELKQLFDIDDNTIIPASAKNGIGIHEILGAIIERIPAPQSQTDAQLKALLFDSWYDDYKGVVCLIAIKDGTIKKGDRITLDQTGRDYEVLELGIMYPNETPMDALYAGQVGYLISGMKTVQEARVGDTVYHTKKAVPPFPGFKPAKPMVFAGIYPVDSSEFELVRDAIEKLTLNDASVTVEKKSSTALGLGFRCGFLGLLHMINGTIILPQQYLGNILALCQEKRGRQLEMTYLSQERIILRYKLPLAEVATDFYDQLKSLSSGYASFDYEEGGYEPSDLVKMDMLLNGKPVDALSTIVHRDAAYYIGRDLVKRLRESIPRQLFEVAIQAAVGAKILARESISPLRKDVIAKCYGGDVTRKNKLLDKQKEGKKKMKQVGNVEVPQEAFLSILRKTT